MNLSVSENKMARRLKHCCRFGFFLAMFAVGMILPGCSAMASGSHQDGRNLVLSTLDKKPDCIKVQARIHSLPPLLDPQRAPYKDCLIVGTAGINTNHGDEKSAKELNLYFVEFLDRQSVTALPAVDSLVELELLPYTALPNEITSIQCNDQNSSWDAPSYFVYSWRPIEHFDGTGADFEPKKTSEGSVPTVYDDNMAKQRANRIAKELKSLIAEREALVPLIPRYTESMNTYLNDMRQTVGEKSFLQVERDGISLYVWPKEANAFTRKGDKNIKGIMALKSLNSFFKARGIDLIVVCIPRHWDFGNIGACPMIPAGVKSPEYLDTLIEMLKNDIEVIDTWGLCYQYKDICTIPYLANHYPCQSARVYGLELAQRIAEYKLPTVSLPMGLKDIGVNYMVVRAEHGEKYDFSFQRESSILMLGNSMGYNPLQGGDIGNFLAYYGHIIPANGCMGDGHKHYTKRIMQNQDLLKDKKICIFVCGIEHLSDMANLDDELKSDAKSTTAP